METATSEWKQTMIWSRILVDQRNITSAPTDVYVFQKGNNTALGTFQTPPPEPAGGWDKVTAVAIRY
jgi:hypothetical protein